MHDKLMQITQQASWHDRLPRYAYLAHLVRDKRVLDLGCGTGEGAALLAEAGARQVLAIDPSSASIEHARATYELPNLSFIARFVEDPLDAGQLTESGDFDSADPLAAADAFEAQLTSVRIAAPSPLETQSTESDDAPSEPPEGEESGTQPALAEPEQVHEAIAEPEPTHEAELAPESTETVPALEPDLGPEPSSETEAPLESESAPQSTSAGGGERFDIVLAINPDLPINDPAFLQRLLSFLDEGGFLVVSARIDGSHCLSDLLAHFEPGTNPGEPVTFADSEALRQHFAQLGLSAREVVQHAALSTRFAPANEPERAIDRVFGSTRESIPRFRLFFLFKGEARDVGAFECHVPLEPLVAQLGEGINALVSRISRLEHRALLFEEQLAQKDGLTDDLEEELRRAEGMRRTLEDQNHSLQAELDKLQGELTQPPESHVDAAALEQREQRLNLLQAQIELDETLLAGMREALQAQRLTIDALSVRLQLDAPVQSRQLAVENFDFDGEDDPSALRERLRHALNVLAERDEELGGRQRELAQVGAELERQMHEASTRRSEADFLQGQLKVEEQRVLGLRAELEAAEKKAQRQQRQASEQLEKALTSAKNAEEQRAIWEARYTALQAQLEELAAGDARHQASIAELRAEVDTLRSMNEKSEALLARFRRGRRERRLAAGLD